MDYSRNIPAASLAGQNTAFQVYRDKQLHAWLMVLLGVQIATTPMLVAIDFFLQTPSVTERFTLIRLSVAFFLLYSFLSSGDRGRRIRASFTDMP